MRNEDEEIQGLTNRHLYYYYISYSVATIMKVNVDNALHAKQQTIVVLR